MNVNVPLVRFEWYKARVEQMTPQTIEVNLRDLRAQAEGDFRWNDGTALLPEEASDTLRCIELLESHTTAAEGSEMAQRIRAEGANRSEARRKAYNASAALATLARRAVGVNMSQAEFARLAGVPESTVKRWLDTSG